LEYEARNRWAFSLRGILEGFVLSFSKAGEDI
jgi:hypothetical protein